MRRLPALTVSALLALPLSACGEAGEEKPRPAGAQRPPSDERAILETMRSARDAVLAGDAQTACALLTPQGRELAVRVVRYSEEGTVLPRSPRSQRACERVLEPELARARQPGLDVGWLSDLRRSSFTVLGVRGSRARARLTVEEPYVPPYLLVLRKTPAGWRIDDAPSFSALERVPERRPRRERPTPRGAPPPPPPPPPPTPSS